MKQIKILILALSVAVLIWGAKHFLLSNEAPQPVTTTVTDTQPASPSTTSESASPAASPVAAATNAATLPEIKVLDEIFQTKNDNDPRMDKELKNLSPAAKAALRAKYENSKPELRNERGTIAFLIGREVRDGRGTKEDVEFLKNILMEKPCLSLSDCSKANQGGSPEEQHLEAIHETTAHYPQLMDLRYMKQALEGGNLSSEMRASIIAALEAAKNSPNARVVQEAQAILNSLPH